MHPVGAHWERGGLYGDSNTAITGRVTDPANRAVPGAEIRLQNLATFVEATVTTNSEGVYEERPEYSKQA